MAAEAIWSGSTPFARLGVVMNGRMEVECGISLYMCFSIFFFLMLTVLIF